MLRWVRRNKMLKKLKVNDRVSIIGFNKRAGTVVSINKKCRYDSIYMVLCDDREKEEPCLSSELCLISK